MSKPVQIGETTLDAKVTRPLTVLWYKLVKWKEALEPNRPRFDSCCLPPCYKTYSHKWQIALSPCLLLSHQALCSSTEPALDLGGKGTHRSLMLWEILLTQTESKKESPVDLLTCSYKSIILPPLPQKYPPWCSWGVQWVVFPLLTQHIQRSYVLQTHTTLLLMVTVICF